MELNGSINDEQDPAESSRSLLADTKAVQLEMNPPLGSNHAGNYNSQSNGFSSASNSPQVSNGKRIGGMDV